jgi:hypothetical protein
MPKGTKSFHQPELHVFVRKEKSPGR